MMKRKAVKKQDVAPFKMDDPEVARRKAFAEAASRALQDSRDERGLLSKAELRATRVPGSTVMDPERQRRLRIRRRLRPGKLDPPDLPNNQISDVAARVREERMGKFGRGY